MQCKGDRMKSHIDKGDVLISESVRTCKPSSFSKNKFFSFQIPGKDEEKKKSTKNVLSLHDFESRSSFFEIKFEG